MKIAVFDIETALLLAYLFRLGKQVVRSSQLDKSKNEWDVISVAWIDSESRKAKSLDWGYGAESSSIMLKKFDEIIKDYQKRGFLIVGKNNTAFDNKHLNALRFLRKHEPLPEWTKYVADMQTHFKQNFTFPSQSLDYLSEIAGYGGKIPMEFQDWVDICEAKLAHQLIADSGYKAVKNMSETLFKRPLKELLAIGKIKLKKMVEYNKKDVEDTLNLFEDAIPYLKDLKNTALNTRRPNGLMHLGQNCTKCGSTNLIKKGTAGNFQHYGCKDCPRTSNGSLRYAGRAFIKPNGDLRPTRT